MSEWKDIATAPKDGTWVLVKQEGVLEPSVFVCAFDADWGSDGDGDGWWLCCNGKDPEIPLRGPAPSYWTEIPAFSTESRAVDP
jgi:hypothetical protein